MAPISFVIDILLRWVMMLRTRMTRRSGGCRWRSNVRETRRRCGRRDWDWSCRVSDGLTDTAGTIDQSASLGLLRHWLWWRLPGGGGGDCDYQIHRHADRVIGGVHRTGAAESDGERETVPGRPGAVARIARDVGPGLPRHGDTEHAHLAPPYPRLPSRSRTSWPIGPWLSEARGVCVLCFVGVTTSVNISALVVSCHSNNSHTIPARIIQQWNFNKYWVSRLKLCSGNSQVYETWTRHQHLKRKWRNCIMLYSSDLSC